MKKPYIIGIAGGSASGKSTFCAMLEKRFQNFKVASVHMDHYFKPEADRPRSNGPASDTVYMDDNHPETMDLKRMRNDIRDMALRNEYDIIIAEGLLTLYGDLFCDMLDLKLFVECRPDERIVRRLKRNMEWGLSFDEIANVYLDLVRYRHDEYVEPTKWKADLIINGSAMPEKAVDIIYAAVTLLSGRGGGGWR